MAQPVRQVVANNQVVEPYTILDFANSDPLTGMTDPTDITLDLQRESSGAVIAASETLTITEIGATGRYYYTFTPSNSGLYIVYIKELHADSLQRTDEFRYDVVSAGAAFSPSYSNAYCAETDIERFLQYSITSSTKPNDTETGAFAEERAAVLSSLCTGWGFAVTPSTIVAGTRLEDLLRAANAIGGALDYTVAQQLGRTPADASKRVEFYEGLWIQYVGGQRLNSLENTVGWIEKEIKMNLAALATDQILSGDTAAAPVPSTPPINEGIEVTMGEDF